MPSREIFEWVEIDVPRCVRVYGSSPCAAVLGTTGPRKCFNTRGTCQDPDNYSAGTPYTLKLSRKGLPLPRGFKAFPVLTKLSQATTTVNVAGSDPKLGALGKRGAVAFEAEDFTHHDRDFDQYVAGRIDGTAQVDEGGYLPQERGTFFAKLKARWPEYAGADVRVCRAYADGGILSDQTTYSHIMKGFDGPSKGVASFDAWDILDLANERTALCPKPSRGLLTFDLTISATTFDITPAEVADEYAASGWVCIGSEVMAFTRSGATFTVTRGQRRTQARTHRQGDTVQQTYSVRLARFDDVAYDLISNFTDTPASWVTFADWQAEVTRWAAGVRLETDVCTPTPVATLLAELGDLGCNVVPDEQAAKLRLRINRPIDGETITEISDDVAFEVETEDRDGDRLTQVYFLSKRDDPTKNLTDDANFLSRVLTVNNDAFDLHDKVSMRTIRTRWLDQGAGAVVAIVSWRLLKRFERAPMRVRVLIDAAYKGIKLTNVVRLVTTDVADDTGNAVARLMQVIERSEPRPYHDIKLTLQRYDFEGRYGFITANDAPVYGSATDEQKAVGGWIVDTATLVFPDGAPPYKVI